MQSYQTQRNSNGYMRKSQAQAKTGINDIYKGVNYKEWLV
jgi:hypothetical protein